MKEPYSCASKNTLLWMHKSKPYVYEIPLPWASGNSVVIQWQSSVPEI